MTAACRMRKPCASSCASLRGCASAVEAESEDGHAAEPHGREREREDRPENVHHAGAQLPLACPVAAGLA